MPTGNWSLTLPIAQFVTFGLMATSSEPRPQTLEQIHSKNPPNETPAQEHATQQARAPGRAPTGSKKQKPKKQD
jgi:hypothetical protein